MTNAITIFSVLLLFALSTKTGAEVRVLDSSGSADLIEFYDAFSEEPEAYAVALDYLTFYKSIDGYDGDDFISLNPGQEIRRMIKEETKETFTRLNIFYPDECYQHQHAKEHERCIRSGMSLSYRVLFKVDDKKTYSLCSNHIKEAGAAEKFGCDATGPYQYCLVQHYSYEEYLECERTLFSKAISFFAPTEKVRTYFDGKELRTRIDLFWIESEGGKSTYNERNLELPVQDISGISRLMLDSEKLVKNRQDD